MIDRIIEQVKELKGYTDWADGGCEYEELVYREEVIRILEQIKELIKHDSRS